MSKLSIVELFTTLLQLEEKFSILYKNIAIIDGRGDTKIKNVANVLARVEAEHVILYNKLIDKMNTLETAILVEAELIETARRYLLTFKQSMSHNTIKSINELLVLAIDYENKNAFILKQILELLAKNNDEHKELVIVFEELIQEEYKHAKNLKQFLKYD